MKYNTRFNPTVNGYLHLGHLYNALVNQAEARASGGVFGVRLDDDQRYWAWKCGDKIPHYADQMREDLAAFGVCPDYWHSQTDMADEVAYLLENEFNYYPEPQAFSANPGAELVGSSIAFYPYVEEITCHKVVMDFIDSVNWLIRGFDLITEDALYRHFAHKFEIPIPKTDYLPRLLFEGDEVSKTLGNFKLKDYRDCAAHVLVNLANDCLIEPDAGWRRENVKPHPVLGGWAYAFHP